MTTSSSRRQNKRETIDDKIIVKDTMQGTVLGFLVNINRNGFMLFGQNVVKEGYLYQLELDAPALFKHLNPIVVGAECLWRKNQDENPHSWAGFHVIDISKKAAKAVEALTAD